MQPLFNNCRPEDAMAVLENIIESYPDFAQAHHDLGYLYFTSGHKEKSLILYERAAMLQSENMAFQKTLADFYYVEQNRVEDALQIYVNILEQNPEHIETLLIAGHLCVALHKFEDAKGYYNRVLEIEPGNRDAKGNLDQLENMPPGSSDSKTPEEMYDQIKPILGGSKVHEAINALERLLETYPDFALAHNDLGVLYYRGGESEKALTHYEKAAQLQPENITFKKNLADFYCVVQGRIEDALKIYVDVLGAQPEDIETLLVTGHICASLEKIEDARVFYNRVLEIEPWNLDARESLDKLDDPATDSSNCATPEEMYRELKSLMEGENLQDAVDALEKLLDNFSDYALAHNDLGVLYYRIGNKDKALYHYESAARLQPDNIVFKKNIADFYFVEQSRTEDALKIYVDVLTDYPEDVETLLITGNICVMLHKFEDAKVFFSRVLEIEPWNADARETLDKLNGLREAV